MSPGTDRPAGDAGEPFLCVISGNPTPEEIAAVVAVLLERDGDASAAARPASRPGSAWADPARVLRHARQRLPGHGSRGFPGG